MKPLKIAFILILTIGIFQNVFPQQLKTYNGPYKEGNALYQYFENGDERIYQGTFKYTSENITLNGQYDKNRRVGQWTIIKILKQDLGNYKELVTGKYIDGEMNGLWTLKRTDLSTKNILKESSAQFISGFLDSSFNFYSKEFSEFPTRELRQLTLKGKFVNGKFESTWITGYTVDRIPFEEVIKYNNGSIISCIIKNLSTGEIIKKSYDDYIYSQVFDLWQRIKTPNFYDFEDPYIHVRSTSDIDKLLKVFRSSDMQLNESNTNSPELEDKRNLAIESKFNSTISRADSAFNTKKYDDATILYRNALLLKDSPYADSQLEKLSELRLEQEKIIKEEKERKEMSELLSLLKERKTKYYDLDSLSKADFSIVKSDVRRMLYSKIKDFEFDELSIGGVLLITLDTAQVVTVNTAQLTSNRGEVLKTVTATALSLTLPIQKIRNYKVNIKASVPIDTKCSKTVVSFKLKKPNEIVYSKNEPSDRIKQLIRKTYKMDSNAQNLGNYTVEYFFGHINDQEYEEVKTIKYKLGVGGLVDYMKD